MMATTDDAQLILKLYELRTEETMRKARKFVLDFKPESFAEIAAVQNDFGGEKNSYWRQALSYWDMAAALVLHGALDGELFAAANGEPFFYYAKFTPFFEEWQKAYGNPFMALTGQVVEKFPTAKRKYDAMLGRMTVAKR